MHIKHLSGEFKHVEHGELHATHSNPSELCIELVVLVYPSAHELHAIPEKHSSHFLSHF